MVFQMLSQRHVLQMMFLAEEKRGAVRANPAVSQKDGFGQEVGTNGIGNYSSCRCVTATEPDSKRSERDVDSMIEFA